MSAETKAPDTIQSVVMELSEYLEAKAKDNRSVADLCPQMVMYFGRIMALAKDADKHAARIEALRRQAYMCDEVTIVEDDQFSIDGDGNTVQHGQWFIYAAGDTDGPHETLEAALDYEVEALSVADEIVARSRKASPASEATK